MKTLTEVLRQVPCKASWSYCGIQYWFIAEGVNFGKIMSSKQGELGTLEVQEWLTEDYKPTIITGYVYLPSGKRLSLTSDTLEIMSSLLQ